MFCSQNLYTVAFNVYCFRVYRSADFCTVEQLIAEDMGNVASTAHKKLVFC
jgi:hypothetical protein